MNYITLVYPYYRNPEMLKRQVQHWNEVAAVLGNFVRVNLIDDASPEPAEPIFRDCVLKKGLWRINENIPWNQHGARNLGAKVSGKDCEWLFMTDMDIVVPIDTLSALVNSPLDKGKHYTFERCFVDGRPPKYHCNTFLVTRGNYWKAGGYDEDFCGAYGGDGIFLRALARIAPRQHMFVRVLGYNDTIADCSTREWGRKETEFHKEYLRRRDEKKAKPDGLAPKNPLRFTWSRVL